MTTKRIVTGFVAALSAGGLGWYCDANGHPWMAALCVFVALCFVACVVEG
jgi:hypothetical protein